jgi:hypothetical protein
MSMLVGSALILLVLTAGLAAALLAATRIPATRVPAPRGHAAPPLSTPRRR